MRVDLRVAWRLGVPLLAVLATASCSSVDPALESKIEEEWSLPSSTTVRESGTPAPWKVGQWGRVRVDDGGTRGIRTYLVAKKEGSAYWVEFHDTWPDVETRSAVLVENYDSTAGMRGLLVTRVMVRQPDGEVFESAVGAEPLASPEAQEVLDRVETTIDLLRNMRPTGKVEDVSVPAGTFRSSLARPIYMTRGGNKFRGFVWYSGAVPVSSVVKAEFRQPVLEVFSHTRTIELVAFGETGVESHFFQ